MKQYFLEARIYDYFYP